MRTLGAGGRALALVPLLLATAARAPGTPAHAAAQSGWSAEVAAGYGSGLGDDLGGSGSVGLHAEIVVTDANGQEPPSLAFLQTRTVGVGLE